MAPSAELIWVASKSKKYFFNYGMGKILNDGKQMRNVWEINSQRHLTEHPTEKPENLLERILLLGSKKQQKVLDPFMGSGTTGVICKRLKRKFIGIELDKEYFKLAKNRIAKEKNKAIVITDKKIRDNESKVREIVDNIKEN